MIFLYRLVVDDYDISHIDLNKSYLLTDTIDPISKIVQYIAKYLLIRQNYDIRTKIVTFSICKTWSNINNLDVDGNVSTPYINTLIPIRTDQEDILCFSNIKQKMLMKTVKHHAVAFDGDAIVSFRNKYSENLYLNIKIYNTEQVATPYIVNHDNRTTTIKIKNIKRDDITTIEDEIFLNTIFDTVYCYQKNENKSTSSVYIRNINDDVTDFVTLGSPLDFKISKINSLHDSFYNDVANMMTKRNFFIVRKSNLSYIEKIIVDIVESQCSYDPFQTSIYVNNKLAKHTPNFIINLENTKQTKIAFVNSDAIVVNLFQGEVLYIASCSDTQLVKDISSNNLYLHVMEAGSYDSRFMLDKTENENGSVPTTIVDVVNNDDTANIYEIDTKTIIDKKYHHDILPLIKSEFESETEQDFDEILSTNKMIFLKNHTKYDIFSGSPTVFNDIFIKKGAICQQTCIDILQKYSEHSNIESTDILPSIQDIFIKILAPFIETQCQTKTMNVNNVYIASYNSTTKKIYSKAKYHHLRVLLSLNNTDVIFNNTNVSMRQGYFLLHAFEKDVVMKTKSTNNMYMLIYDIFFEL